MNCSSLTSLLKLTPTSTRLSFGSCFLLLGYFFFMSIGGSYSTLDPFTLPTCPLTTPTLLRSTSRILSLLDDCQLLYRRCLAYCATTGLFSPSPELPLRLKNKQTEYWYKQRLSCNSVVFRPSFQVPMPCPRPPLVRIFPPLNRSHEAHS